MGLWIHDWRLDYLCLDGLREGSIKYIQREAYRLMDWAKDVRVQNLLMEIFTVSLCIIFGRPLL
jgi:hypothetical protein